MHCQLLQSVNLAQPYADSKTIVDKPTNGTANHTLADFNKLDVNGTGSITEAQIVQFLDQDFVRSHISHIFVALTCIVTYTCSKAKGSSSKLSN